MEFGAVLAEAGGGAKSNGEIGRSTVHQTNDGTPRFRDFVATRPPRISV